MSWCCDHRACISTAGIISTDTGCARCRRTAKKRLDVKNTRHSVTSSCCIDMDRELGIHYDCVSTTYQLPRDAVITQPIPCQQLLHTEYTWYKCRTGPPRNNFFNCALSNVTSAEIRTLSRSATTRARARVSQFTVNPAVSTWCVCMYCMCAMLCRRLNVYEL